MTAKQKFAANEQREALFTAAWWSCVVCLESLGPTAQLAHRVAKTVARLNTYGPVVMHHPLNLVPVCSLRCNDACNIGNRPVEAKALLDRIIRVTTGIEPQPRMRDEYAALREEFKEAVHD